MHIRPISLRQVMGGLEESAVNLPSLMDQMLSSALSSVDDASGGILSKFAGPNVDFARTENGSHLIARVHMPPAGSAESEKHSPRRLSVALVGKNHLRIKLEVQSGGLQTTSIHTVALPESVSKDGILIVPKEDGTVHINLRILKQSEDAENHEQDEEDGEDKSGLFDSFLGNRGHRMLFPLHMLLGDEEANGSQVGASEQLPSTHDISGCREKYGEGNVGSKKCLCDVTPSDGKRAVCYGEMISKAVKIGRSLRMDDFATQTKHMALDCANSDESKTAKCLGEIAKEVIEKLYQDKDFKGRVRTAIESEDSGPSEFEGSLGWVVSKMILIAILLMGIFWIVSIGMFRRSGGSSSGRGVVSQLSSVLTQHTSSSGKVNGIVGKGGEGGSKIA